jgi:glucan phosphoethanolaminetransferase (alkaline phosphatase superfamily)
MWRLLNPRNLPGAGKLAPFLPLLALAGAQLLLSAAYIATFSHTYGYGRRLMFAHLLIVGGLVAGVTASLAGAALAGGVVTRRAPVRLAFSGAHSLLFSLLAVLYLADFFSNRLWGENVFYQLVFDFLSRGPGRAEALGPGHARLLAVVLIAGAGAVAAYAALFDLALRRAARGCRRGPTAGRAALACAAAAVFVLPALGAAAAWRMQVPWLARREPIASFFLLNSFVAPDARPLDAILAEERSRARLAAARPAFERKNVVVILVDALRADHLPFYGYGRQTAPFLTGLHEAGRLRRVKLALSTCPSSLCGIASTLGSKHYRRLSLSNFKLHELLGDQGYRRYFLLSGNHDHWGGLFNITRYYGDGAERVFDGNDSRRYAVSDDRLLLEGLAEVPPSAGAPAFFYFHLMSVHQAGVRLPPYAFLPAEEEGATDLLGVDETDPVRRLNSYDNGVLQADAIIKDIFAALDAKGYLADSVVVILSDHGDALSEHGSYGHTRTLYQEEIRIPLLIYDAPGVAYPNLEFARQVDVAPTIVDRLGLPIPTVWEGRSLLRPDGVRYSYHETEREGGWRGVIERADGRLYKYLCSELEGREELYELTSDPDEKRNLIADAPPELIGRLKGALARRP